MREKFLRFADSLIKQEECSLIYKELSDVFDEVCMFHEEGACKEKLWHITQEPKLYKEVGDIFGNKVGNFGVAFEAYNRYLKNSDPEFFNNYQRIMKKIGYDVNLESNDDDNFSDVTKLCDIYDTIIYMMIYLFQAKEYSGIFELEKRLTVAFNNIQNYINKNPECNSKDCLADNEGSRVHLSEILSQEQHHNDLNKLAIKLNSNNKQAYMNITGDFITYKNYNDAMLFYNYTYCNVFGTPLKSNIIDICWDISDYYRDKYDFYNAVLFQKYALELELAEN